MRRLLASLLVWGVACTGDAGGGGPGAGGTKNQNKNRKR
jgi:hypothetical protein